MAERIYYVISKDNCQFEGLTKEQVFAAIAEATGNTPTKVDEAFITKIKEQNKNTNLKIWVGTAAEFNALTEKDADTLYVYPDTTLEDVEDTLQKVINGTTPVAKASHAANADNATNAAEAEKALYANSVGGTDFTNSEWSETKISVQRSVLESGATYQIDADISDHYTVSGIIYYNGSGGYSTLYVTTDTTTTKSITYVTANISIAGTIEEQSFFVQSMQISLQSLDVITAKKLPFRYRRIK